MTDRVDNLIADCDVILGRLYDLDLKDPWIIVGSLSVEGVRKQVIKWLEGLAEDAARVDVADPPPAPPPPPELYSPDQSGMTTRRGIPLAVGYVKKLQGWADSLLPKANPPKAGNGAQPAETKPSNPYQKKNVNAKMLDKMQKDSADGSRECHGWTCARWARFLKCSTASVVTTRTWKDLEPVRERLKAERARDRRGRGTGRRKGDFGQD